MDINQIHPELRHVIRFLPPLPFHHRYFTLFVDRAMRLIPSRRIKGVTIHEERAGSVAVRVYSAANVTPSGAGLLWIHGGGLIMGKAAMDDDLCARYARDLGLTVVSVDYRLAPRAPYPAAIDDCFEAWNWFVRRAPDWGIDPNRIAIAGQSAGGGLTASLAQRIHDAGSIQPAAQVLFCPMLDDRTAANTTFDAINHRLWNNSSNRAGWSAYLRQAPGLPDVPEYAVPARRQNLSGLPPAWIGVGDVDLFYDEDRDYSERLAEHGVRAQLHTAPMAPHGFERLVPDAPLTRSLFASNYRFLRETLGIG